MPIFTDKEGKRILFVHVPKCGGSTIERWFLEAGFEISLFSETLIEGMNVTPQHLSIQSIKKLQGNHINFDYVFSFVRNPYERIESEYFFRLGNIDKNKRPDFSNWVLKSLQVYKRYPQYQDNHFRPQVYFISKTVDVFKLEDGLEQGLEIISRKLGIKTPVPKNRVNASARETVKWSRRAIQKVNQIYSEDFEKFGYRKLPAITKKNDKYLDCLDSLVSRFR